MPPFILPFALYLVLAQISSHASSYYPLVYTVGLVVVSVKGVLDGTPSTANAHPWLDIKKGRANLMTLPWCSP